MADTAILNGLAVDWVDGVGYVYVEPSSDAITANVVAGPDGIACDLVDGLLYPIIFVED